MPSSVLQGVHRIRHTLELRSLDQEAGTGNFARSSQELDVHSVLIAIHSEANLSYAPPGNRNRKLPRQVDSSEVETPASGAHSRGVATHPAHHGVVARCIRRASGW